ncbi:hypothetical protein [Actinomyces vulturis]|uniref:hypothetical protein n=1 Tax=Actinomyces vulturis TaxID=1857645 RepID=UPI00114631A2|nr:hypothetical protein [Actinomyces vulturis]
MSVFDSDQPDLAQVRREFTRLAGAAQAGQWSEVTKLAEPFLGLLDPITSSSRSYDPVIWSAAASTCSIVVQGAIHADLSKKDQLRAAEDALARAAVLEFTSAAMEEETVVGSLFIIYTTCASIMAQAGRNKEAQDVVDGAVDRLKSSRFANVPMVLTARLNAAEYACEHLGCGPTDPDEAWTRLRGIIEESASEDQDVAAVEILRQALRDWIIWCGNIIDSELPTSMISSYAHTRLDELEMLLITPSALTEVDRSGNMLSLERLRARMDLHEILGSADPLRFVQEAASCRRALLRTEHDLGYPILWNDPAAHPTDTFSYTPIELTEDSYESLTKALRKLNALALQGQETDEDSLVGDSLFTRDLQMLVAYCMASDDHVSSLYDVAWTVWDSRPRLRNNPSARSIMAHLSFLAMSHWRRKVAIHADAIRTIMAMSDDGEAIDSLVDAVELVDENDETVLAQGQIFTEDSLKELATEHMTKSDEWENYTTIARKIVDEFANDTEGNGRMIAVETLYSIWIDASEMGYDPLRQWAADSMVNTNAAQAMANRDARYPEEYVGEDGIHRAHVDEVTARVRHGDRAMQRVVRVCDEMYADGAVRYAAVASDDPDYRQSSIQAIDDVIDRLGSLTSAKIEHTLALAYAVRMQIAIEDEDESTATEIAQIMEECWSDHECPDLRAVVQTILQAYDESGFAH